MNLAPLHGKRLAILVAGKDASGEEDWRAAVGTARVEGTRLFVDWDEGGESLELEPPAAASPFGDDYLCRTRHDRMSA